jgi:hypothetical protein
MLAAHTIDFVDPRIFRELDFLANSDSTNCGESAMAKPPLTVIDPAATGIQPPRKLGRHGLDLWRTVMADYQIEDRGGIELLAQAAAALDRAEALAEQIDRDGEIVHGRQGPRPHPGLQAELAARSFIVRTLERLGLNMEAVKPIGRPPTKPARKHGDE